MFFLLSACAMQVQAQWSTDPNVDNKLNARVYNPLTFCTDGHGGAFFTYQQTFTGQTRYIIVNRIDSSGHLRLGDSGIILKTVIGSGDLGAPEICEDGNSGCYITYENNVAGHPLYIHHLNADGVNLWADTGMLVTDKFTNQFYQNYYSLINDNNQGVMVAFFTRTGGAVNINGIYGQRLNFNGQRQWGDHGVVIEESYDSRDLRVISDGKRGMAMLWSNFGGGSSSYLLRMQHINHDGQALFTNGIKKLNNRMPVGIAPFARLVLTQNKNYIAVWNAPNTRDTIYMQKVDSLGNSLWGDLEIKVADSTGEKSNPDLMSDGGEGAYCLWQDGRKVFVTYGVYAQHINGDGVKQWDSQGALIDSNTAGGGFTCPYLAPDINGNIKAFYKGSDFRTHLQVLNSSGIRQMAGNGMMLTPTIHDLLYYKAVLPVADNHDILFLKYGGNGDCYAKYVPFASVLPVTFIAFSAENQSSHTILNWQTANEINTDYFSVERSEDGSRFYEIGTIKAKHSAMNNYHYEDAVMSDNNVYYRIKETDANGNFFYSKIISLGQRVSSAFRIVPNPVRNQCILYLDAKLNETATVKIFDMNGKLVKQKIINLNSGTVTMNLSDVVTGVYLCNVQTGNQVYSQKLIVVR